MPLPRSDHRRRTPSRPTRLLLALPAGCALLAAAALPAQAAPADRPADDSAGASSAAHEGWSAGPDVAAVPAGVPGLDVSSHQGDVDWATAYRNGARFAYVKATEGTTYTNPYYPQQYGGSHDAGLLRGAYHFATPDTSSGTAQADFFVDHGGAWVKDGTTLPPMLDIEYDPYGSDICFGLTPAQMVPWIKAFSREVRARTGRNPVIFTTAGWWNRCTGSSTLFGTTNPLIISRWSDTPFPLPAGWKTYRFWQHSPKGRFPGDQEVFHGTMAALKQFAVGNT